MFGAVCSTSREESCRRMHTGFWGRVLRYNRIRSRHIEWSTHRGAKGLVRVNDLINKYADDNVISVLLRIRGSPRRAVLLMLRRLESQCTGGARESEEVKVKGGKREGG